ncbi:MAG: sulfite exporter TauE/SafE family protein [Saprospiraceae bacterium]|nr:sulfite exporter TauE/SafE family protein [Saprospiraceae bacterium]
MPIEFLAVLFFFIAAVYASVGFGGGSSYIAVLAVSGLAFQDIRVIALVCNILVVLGNTSLFYQNGWWSAKKYLPIVLAGVPLAFLGAATPIKESTFFILLAGCLLLAGWVLWFQPVGSRESHHPDQHLHSIKSGCISGSIGYFSGLVGIGGGIFLSPVLHFLRWDHTRHISVVASLFILFNSVAGLAGLVYKQQFNLRWDIGGWLFLAVIVGGQLGARSSLKWLSVNTVRKTTAVLVFIAGIELLLKHLN